MMGENLPPLQSARSDSHYSMVRIWDLTGSVIRVLRGHTDYVYEVALGNNGELLSCGEDHTVVGTF